MIPKVIHMVWIGDESKRPDNCIDTWREMNPSYELRVWGNKEFDNTNWINAKHIKEMYKKELNGVADMMRYEILYTHGGIAFDADSFCIRPLEDWLLEPLEIACWENETKRPGLIACNCLGSVPKSKFYEKVIQYIKDKDTVVDRDAWKSVGPQAMTDVWKSTEHPLTIYPSHYFVPNHFASNQYSGTGQVFSRQFWASTFNKNDTLHTEKVKP